MLFFLLICVILGKFFMESWEMAVCKIQPKSGMWQQKSLQLLVKPFSEFAWWVLVSLFKEGLFLFANVFLYFL